MSYYEDVYLKRLNRYGTDYQSRVQAQREREFEGKLLKSIYRVDFEYDNETHPATLEKYKQDETQLLQYLLTRVSLNLPNGTILMIPDKDFELQPWMVFWMESIKASGYNKYVVLKMSHWLTWRGQDGDFHSTWAYLHGAGDSKLAETLRTIGAVYTENDNNTFIIFPRNEFLRKDDYIEIGEGAFKEAFRVTGYDIHSTQGVEYATLNPIYLQNQTPAPERTGEEDSEKYFWLNGGEN